MSPDSFEWYAETAWSWLKINNDIAIGNVYMLDLICTGTDLQKDAEMLSDIMKLIVRGEK